MSEAGAFNVSLGEVKVNPREPVLLLAAEWHAGVVDMMVDDAVRVLKEHGVRDIRVLRVPGVYELPQATAMYLNAYAAQQEGRNEFVDVAGVICFGVVVQGETPHFTFIADAVSHGLQRLACELASVPLLFGVLTTNTIQQARDRADGTHSRKGEELAIALLKMMQFRQNCP